MITASQTRLSGVQHIQPGQNVELISDLYGAKMVFHGKVEGLGGGTGSAFAVIPAQNATGNWIKVVQRLPVRIALDARELADHPLRVGVSMTAKVYLDASPQQTQPAAARAVASRPARTVATSQPDGNRVRLAQAPLLRTRIPYADTDHVRLAQTPLLRTVAPRASYADNDVADPAPILRTAGSRTSY